MEVVPAFWDDELQSLAVKVLSLFGDDALDACVERATAATFTGGPSDDPLVPPGQRFRDTLKAELRQRLAPEPSN
jgi:hypothetical protein